MVHLGIYVEIQRTYKNDLKAYSFGEKETLSCIKQNIIKRDFLVNVRPLFLLEYATCKWSKKYGIVRVRINVIPQYLIIKLRSAILIK